ncbi:MAG TPA: FG-GAP repeat protein, partial [Kofleriaceae bacterium]|nr:FG-GAP repeat protein [Kofleriaceae bacterium]
MTALIAACGFPRPPDVKGTNLPVGGNVHGMWTGADGVALRLTANGVDTLYTVTANEPFTFPSTLAEDVSYAVTVVSSPGRHTCAIQAGAAGVVGTSGVSSIDVACAGPPVSVALSAPAAWTFDPTQQVQLTFNASVVLQDVTVTVGSPDGQIMSVQVAGGNVSLGQPSPPQVLALGANMVRVDLTAQGGLSTTYQIAIDRGGAKVAQWTYGKATNTGTRDFFGTAVAIDGDTLVVGASGESSAATTVNGDQNNDNAQGAGAAYVFRRTGDRWIQEAYLKASNTETFDDFGISVAVSGDTVAVGAFGEDSGSVGVNGDPTNN